MEQIQFIYFQYYMQYYTVHHKENSTYMEIWQRGWWFKLRPQVPACFGFTIVLFIYLGVLLQRGVENVVYCCLPSQHNCLKGEGML